MLIQKYEPKSLKEILGNKMQILQIRNWLREWKKGSALILNGPPGVGKTLSVKLLAKELGCELVESYASDDRSASSIKESLLIASRQRSLFYTRKLFLIDDAECIDSAKPVIDVIKSSEFPVILITSDPYDRKFYNIRKYCKIVKFQRIRYDIISEFLQMVCEKEGIKYDKRAIGQLSKNCNGDVRAAITDLESSKNIDINYVKELGYRNIEENVFETLKILFKATSIESLNIALENFQDEIVPWIAENLAEEYESPDEIAKAYNFLSKGDIFSARIIKRQSWSLQKYFFNISALGVALSKKKPYSKFTSYKPPRFRSSKVLPDSLLSKIAGKTHVSRRRALDYIILLRNILETTGAAKELGLTDEEVESILS